MASSRNTSGIKKIIAFFTKKQKIQVTVPKLPHLLLQPKDTAHMQAAYLDTKSLASVSATCRSASALFREPLSKRPLQILLRHVAHGEQKQAEAIIKNQPDLLFKADTVMDYSGRTLQNVTPITAAYGADDVDMLVMMFKYLDKPSKDKAIHHIKEKCAEEKESKSYDFNPLVAAITANENVEAVLEQFRNDFTPGVVEKGKHFNIKILLDAYQAYIDNWHPWTDEQRSLFFLQVIGHLQNLLPACYAQAFCQGLYKVTDDGKPLQRELKLDDGSFFYATANSHIGLGYNFAIYSGRPTPMEHAVVGQYCEQRVRKLWGEKTSALRDLMQRQDFRAEQACAIM